jgi:hypothetical protein
MLFVHKMTYLAWADIRQPVLLGLDKFADICQPVLLGLARLAHIRQPVLLGLARLAHIRQRSFLEKCDSHLTHSHK